MKTHGHYQTADAVVAYESRRDRNPLEAYLDAHWRPYLMQSVASLAERSEALCDLGTGTGLYLSAAEGKGARLVGVDASAEMLKEARARVPDATLLERDATSTGLPDASFDAVVAIGLLEYVDPDALAAEAFRLLRPGGTFLMQTPNRRGGEKGIYLFKQRMKRRPRVQRYLSRTECTTILQRAGFQLDRVVMSDGLVWLPGPLPRLIGPIVYRTIEAFWRIFGRNPFSQNMVFWCRRPQR